MRREARGSPAAVITGIGLCSSMGGAVTACAAARAGISRPTTLEFKVEDDETGTPEGATGHVAPPVAPFIGRARLIALADEALRDLRGSDPDFEGGAACGFALCLTDQETRRWAPEPEEGEEAEEAPDPREQQRADLREREQIAASIADLAGLRLAPRHRRCYAAGAAGLAAAIEDAVAAFQTGELEACIVGAVDSLVQPAVLEYLNDDSRLKTPDEPNGLIPGEAAAFLVLERPDLARQRRRPALGTVTATAREQGEDPELVERPPRGTALLALFTRLLTAAPPRGPFWVVTDQNGETFRALEWADFVIRSSGRLPDVGSAPLWYPAIAFGDTGAASGALGVCVALRAFARGYAPAPTVIVVSATQEGQRGAVCLERP